MKRLSKFNVRNKQIIIKKIKKSANLASFATTKNNCFMIEKNLLTDYVLSLVAFLSHKPWRETNVTCETLSFHHKQEIKLNDLLKKALATFLVNYSS